MSVAAGDSGGNRSLTLVIAVYNAPRNLEFIFAALRRQTFRDFEVIVADDGSGPEIREIVATAKGNSPFPILRIGSISRVAISRRASSICTSTAATDTISWMARRKPSRPFPAVTPDTEPRR